MCAYTCARLSACVFVYLKVSFLYKYCECACAHVLACVCAVYLAVLAFFVSRHSNYSLKALWDRPTTTYIFDDLHRFVRGNSPLTPASQLLPQVAQHWCGGDSVKGR